MIKKLKTLILTIASMSVILAPTLALAPATFAQAAPDVSSNLCCGAQLQVQNCAQSCSSSNDNQLQNLLSLVINLFSIVVGVIAVIMIIVGGLRYITSGGDSGKVGGAKTTIIYALVGLVVVALAQLIVHYVLGQTLQVVNGGGA